MTEEGNGFFGNPVTPAEREHSCPQQGTAWQSRSQSPRAEIWGLLRTGMSALRRH